MPPPPSDRELPPNKVRRIEFFECDSFADRQKVQKLLEESGAVIQEFRFHYKTRSVLFHYTLNASYDCFLDRLEASEQWTNISLCP